LFEKRYAIFDATKLLLSKIPIHGEVTIEDLRTFYGAIRGSEFLFDGEMRQYLKQIVDLCLKARRARRRQGHAKEEQVLEQLIEEEEAILDYLQSQEDRLEKLFGRYLDVSTIGI